jgi:hypothetical protein
MESINVIQPVRVGEPQSVKDASDAEDQPEDHIPMFAVEEKVSLKVWASETICASTSCTTPASPRPRLSGCAQVLPDDPTSTGTIKRGGTFASFSNSLSRLWKRRLCASNHATKRGKRDTGQQASKRVCADMGLIEVPIGKRFGRTDDYL